ncbi:MAG: TetR/AcrR family transcriptional regulator [Actinobacteria bacterium]|nr:TetR/AcrR family transcriptional regulator [Actinomycetota bacterium]
MPKATSKAQSKSSRRAAGKGDAEPRRAPGRPRDPSYDARILHEVLQEIASNGFRRFSVQRVADRAGVAKATVRLRWPKRNDLILAGLGTTSASVSRPRTGSLRGDLAAVVHQYAEVYRNEELMRLYAHLQAEQNDDPVFFEQFQASVARPANEIVLEVIADAQQRGDARADADPLAAARCLVGSLYLQSIAERTNISAEFEAQVVDLMYLALAAEP